jgi:plastocyanin
VNLKWLLALPTVLIACEGEPPKMPAAPPGPAPASSAVPEEPAAETPEAPAPAQPATVPPCACACNCPGTSVAANADAGAGDAGPSAPAAAVAATTAEIVTRTISGTLTTTPKSAAAAAVVYLEDAPVSPKAKMTATVTNKMMTFAPFLAVVPVGGKIAFRNDDPFPHNVFSPDHEKFNLGIIPQRTAAVRVFKSAGGYALLCNLHPGMLGYVFVSPSSYFSKVDGQGRFTIRDVPPGTYKVSAWAPRQEASTQSVTVSDGDVSLDFELHR